VSRGAEARLLCNAFECMKYWEIIADYLSKAGWSWGCVSAIDSCGRTIWIADAHRGDGNPKCDQGTVVVQGPGLERCLDCGKISRF
jgi:hypothetical protein